MELEIEGDLEEMLVRRADHLNFESPETYAKFILRTVFEELEQDDETDAVEDRLEDLGYL
jgi:hypothetical protein